MNISKRIASIREAKGFTQKQIADLLDMEQSNYSRLEGRDNKLTIEQLEKIAGALGVSVIELLTGETPKVVESEEVEKLRDRIKELEKDKKNLNDLVDFYYDFKDVADFYKEYKNLENQDKEKAQRFLKESQSKKAPKGYEPTLSDTLKFFIAGHFLE